MYQTKRRKGLYTRCTEIRYSKKRLNLKIVLAVSGLLLGLSHGVWAQEQIYRSEAVYVGNRVVNACESLPVFSRPEIKVGSSNRPARYLSFGEAVTVETREKMYEVPDTYPSSKYTQCKSQTGGSSRGGDEGGCDGNKNLYQRYEWFGISGGGYAPANCLVHEELFEQQKSKRIASDAITLQGAGGKAKKKSQDVTQNCAAATGGVVTLQGAGGKAKKKAQGQTCSGDFDDYLKALPELNIFSDAMEAFLREGKLGDFAG